MVKYLYWKKKNDKNRFNVKTNKIQIKLLYFIYNKKNLYYLKFKNFFILHNNHHQKYVSFF